MNFQERIYEVHQLGPGLYHIANSAVHMDLIVGSHHALLFDTGYGYGDLHLLVRELTDKPLYVVNSHGHMDHACGNEAFGGAYIHPLDMELCRKHNGSDLRKAELDLAQVPLDFDMEAYLRQGTGKLNPVEEGYCFDLGGITCHVVHLPGHTAGSIGLWCPEIRLLYVGDAINNFVWLFLPESQGLNTYIRTLHKAAQLPFTHMIQSHEPSPVPKKKLWDYLDLAEHLDFSSGRPVPDPTGFTGEVHICTRLGLNHDDRSHPGFAAIMISAEKVYE